MPRMLVIFTFFVFKVLTLLLYFFPLAYSPYSLLRRLSSSPVYQYDVLLDDATTATRSLGRNGPMFTDAASNRSAEVKLILLTYMRSGSSFTGDLFNHHSDVFYVYEPLYPVRGFFSKGEPASFLTRQPIPPRDLPVHALQNHVIRSYLNCSLHELYLRALTHFGLSFGQKTRPFHRCLHARTSHAALPHPHAILDCLPLLQSPCVTSRVIVVKVVRLPMDLAGDVLRSDPKVKVLHLVRDPRATLRSQRAKGMFKKNDLDRMSSKFCQKVLRDLHKADTLKARFPGRVTLARYEDLADEPIRMSESLFEFAGLGIGDGALREYIWTLTSAGLPDNTLSFTQRQSSRETARSWRRRLEFESSRVIDGNCRDVYKRLGYLSLLTERDLRNVSVPSLVRLKDLGQGRDGFII